jgi:hypothetical protein
MKNITLCILFFLLCSSYAYSQAILTGTIKDENNQPLPGANIYIKDTSMGTAADADGSFSLQVPQNLPNATLVISLIGYASQEIVVEQRVS